MPDEVNAHDFPSDAECRAVPYGVYDVTRNTGFVGIGTSHDTPAFAVQVIVTWWIEVGQAAYPDADEILILADSGGSNGCRPHVFKWLLQREFAERFGLDVVVRHYPTGASKWNPIEHRLFGPISLNWRGFPLRSLDDMMAAITGTTTKSGLRVRAQLIPGDYPIGRRVPSAEWKDFRFNYVEDSTTHPKWNYTISSAPPRIYSLN